VHRNTTAREKITTTAKERAMAAIIAPGSKLLDGKKS
jgi:hypothetical protein